METELIAKALKANRVRITEHAEEEAIDDDLSFSEIYESVFQGEVIESYPDDKPYPSCLVYGPSKLGVPIHSVWAHNAKNGWVVLITVYRPEPTKWLNWRKRRT